MKTSINTRKAAVLVSLFLSSHAGISQINAKDTVDLTFTGTKVNPYAQEFDTNGKIKVTGYVDTYYAAYTDKTDSAGFAKFPTASPRNNQFGLNMVMVSAKYVSDDVRGVATLFWGDCPRSSWSTYMNAIQEANVGFRFYKNVWVDMGYFRTHVGLESIQPRENITYTYALTTFWEPYFLSGAKVTWEYSPVWTFQGAIFNNFNTFEETNWSKSLNFSMVYAPNSNISHTFTSLWNNEAKPEEPDNWRQYTDYVMVYKQHRYTIGIEANFSWQKRTALSDKTTYMYSWNLSGKYRLTHKHAIYGRLESYVDRQQMLTGDFLNEENKSVGLDVFGETLGFEYKPIPNAYVRLEGRYLGNSEKVFYYRNHYQSNRYEGVLSIGVWF